VKLKAGDEVGLLLTAGGELQLVVNGYLEANTLKGVPTDVPLFPIVDLLGNTLAISFRPAALAPQVRTRPAPASPPAPVPQAAPKAQAPPAPSGQGLVFFNGLLGEQVRISKDGKSAKSEDATGEKMHGVLFSTEPVPARAAGRYFEVRVDRVRENCGDGLCLGITCSEPEDMEGNGDKPFEVSEEVPDSWTAGYDGYYRSMHMEEVRLRWNPSQLNVGDVVGLLISRTGEFVVVVNGREVARVPDKLPVADSEPTFAVVDLLGRVSGVTMLPFKDPPQAAQVGAVFRGFDPQLLSPNVILTKDRLQAKSTDVKGDELGGVVFGDGPLPCVGEDGESYFEVRIDNLRRGQTDGLVLGVTTAKPAPSAPRDVVAVADEVEEAWTMGYSGLALAPELQEMVTIKWNPAKLKLGDRAGLLVRGDGTLIVFVNSNPVCSARMSKAPVQDDPLYPFIDLLGTAQEVTLTPTSEQLVFDMLDKLRLAEVARKTLAAIKGAKSPERETVIFDAW